MKAVQFNEAPPVHTFARLNPCKDKGYTPDDSVSRLNPHADKKSATKPAAKAKAKAKTKRVPAKTAKSGKTPVVATAPATETPQS